MPGEPATEALPPAAEAFLAYLASQRRAASLTLEAYRRDLARLAGMAGHDDLRNVTSHEIRRFLARLHGQGLAARSLARILSTWRSFFRWLVRHHDLPLNPADGIRAPKADRKLPRVLSPEQAQALLEIDPEEVLEVRDRAMFELFYSSGLRLAELSSIELDGSLDLDEGMVNVTGKRGKSRSVPIGSHAIEALRRWLAERAQLVAADQMTLFVTRTGTPMSPAAVRSRLVRWAARAGLGVHVHPHMLRHSFASHLLQSSGDLRGVQELLGHASIRSTQVYTHLDFQHLARVYDAAHPRARKT